MSVWHPLNALPEGWPTGVAFVVILALLVFVGRKAKPDLAREGVPHRNVVALELAGDSIAAKHIIGNWEEHGLIGEVRRQLRWDAVFILAYSTLTALACVIAARAFTCPLTDARRFALFVAWLPWLAGLLDYAENYAIYRMLGGFEGEMWPRLSASCAALKFAIIITLGLWGLAGVIIGAFRAVRC
ncbi:MAG: hypothetical protein ACJ74T_05390 [Pyrinomonadaceae bacterium]